MFPEDPSKAVVLQAARAVESALAQHGLLQHLQDTIEKQELLARMAEVGLTEKALVSRAGAQADMGGIAEGQSQRAALELSDRIATLRERGR